MPLRHRAPAASELLSPYGWTNVKSVPVRTPGYDGPRPLLSLVLMILEGKVSKTIQQHLELFFDMSSRGSDEYEVLLSHPRALKSAEVAMVTTMRQLADLWIDSGKNPTDRTVDTPADRNVEDVLPGQHVSLLRRINSGLLSQVPQWIGMTRDGRLATKWDLPSLESVGGMDELDAPLEVFGRRMAMYWFIKLLDSPYSRNLARCDSCSIYFAYERAPKRTIKNGIFCSECKGSGSVKRTQSTRDRRNQRRVEIAASFWEQWKPDSRQGKQSTWVAGKVNARLMQLQELQIVITGRWVTQHQQEIELEVGRRNHATRES